MPDFRLDLLRRLGAPATPENLKFLAAWRQAEGGHAGFNPFNTTQPASGASNYNSVGVKNYHDYAQGINATVETLLNGRYGNIVRDLKQGRSSARLAHDVAASPWGTGHGVERVLGTGQVDASWGKPGPTNPPLGKPNPPNPGGKPNFQNPSVNFLPLIQNLMAKQKAYLSGQDYTGPSLAQTILAAQGGNFAQALNQPLAASAGPSEYIPPKQAAAPAAFKGYSGTGVPPWLQLASGVSLQGVNPTLINDANSLAKALGKRITVTSGFRDNKKQAALYRRYADSGFNRAYIAAKPGHSNHNRGQALDLTVGGVPIAEAVKAALLARYGLHNPVAGDLPHTTLLGISG